MMDPLPEFTNRAIVRDYNRADKALCNRAGELLAPLADEDARIYLTVHIIGRSVSVQTHPPPRDVEI